MASEVSVQHPFHPLFTLLRTAVELAHHVRADRCRYHIKMLFVPGRSIAEDARAERAKEHVRLSFSRSSNFDYASLDVYRYRHSIAKESLLIAASRAPDGSYMLWAKLGNTREPCVVTGLRLADLAPALHLKARRNPESALCRAVLHDLTGDSKNIWDIVLVQ